MSGHSKWSSIKHKKGAADAKRGKIFTKLVKEIIVAAKEGGSDQEMNPRLRLAVSTAKGSNMPNSNIERAIKRGTGELEGVHYDYFTYEGYGQNGVAIIVETLTDNKQRTVAEVRHIFSKYGGNLAENGSVSYMFDQKGLIIIPEDNLDEDEVMMASLDAGAEDFLVEDGNFIIFTAYADLHSVLSKLEETGYNIEKAELTRIPQNTIQADEVAEKLLKLIDHLEECDDVQKVYANFEISDEVFERLAEV
ncbi:MAG: YebC/PmpR family DNA-binding transcriptional regulator [Candidatus Cloacimonetes bacterium]|jgi:YebC/PmpR family DNA-binding regulatory protein|nr:YebC/PmpR family DNA-binding transcriptional regulator [Candidatus Cloacimonadota bacterium]